MRTEPSFYEGFTSLLADFITAQPWFLPGGGGPGTMARSGPEPGAPLRAPSAGEARITESAVLLAETPVLVWLAVGLGEEVYQLLVGVRPEDQMAHLRLRESSVLGPLDGPWGRGLAYDALADPELALSFLELGTGSRMSASRVRRVGLEKSNSSLVYDDRLLLKIFRRIRPGRNPEALLAVTLDEVGFNHVAPPVAVWRREPFDLGIVREYLVGGSDGWSLAVASLRDLFARGGAPELAGGDFGAEATRLGEMTARFHLALAQAFGSDIGAPEEWADAIYKRLRSVSVHDDPWASELMRELRSLEHPGCTIPVHGDYHLGRVMRTEVGWFVIDLEGDPGQPLSERHQRLSPLKDVAGMLRSFQYATVAATRERGPAEGAELAGLPDAWEARNRRAFLDGYLTTPDIESLVPTDPTAFEVVLAAFELEKAAKELAFEEGYRPWRAPAIRRALDRLLKAHA